MAENNSIRKYEMHGRHQSAEYQAWAQMIQRCHNPSNVTYKNYGGRGIVVCDHWRGSFMAFLHDMGERPTDKHTLERTDNSKGYHPYNCRWATRPEQARNKRNNRMITFQGETMCLRDWSKQTGIAYPTLHGRLKNWPLEKALTTPVNKNLSRH